MQQQPDDLDGIKEILVEAAEILLPVAKETDWPCRLELVAWLIAVRDSFGKKNLRDIH